jgi:cytochrome c
MTALPWQIAKLTRSRRTDVDLNQRLLPVAGAIDLHQRAVGPVAAGCARAARGKATMECRWRAAIVIALPLVFAATAAGTAESARIRGQKLVTAHCASCHAVGRRGASPLEQALPFRVVARRYPPAALEEALAEGISTGHAEMPEFIFEPPQIAAIVSYLNSLRVNRR